MSKIHHFTGKPSESVYTWENVETEIFNTEDVKGVIKHVLVGPQDGAPNFIIRYFQVPVGSSTFNHAHPHEHGMVILHGNAQIEIEGKTTYLKPYDSVFVSGDDQHQVINIGETPLGFICVITKVGQ
jgi:quercetin dioxygenase-like cupin family protein